MVAADPELANKVLATYMVKKGKGAKAEVSVSQDVLEEEVVVNYLDQVVRGGASITKLKTLMGT